MRANPNIYIYEGEAERLGRWVRAFRDLETGGELFGLYLPSGAFVVQVVTGPGPNARRTSTSFYQDAAYLRAVGVAAFERHALQHGGTWHSHHALDLAEPSGGDSRTMVRALESSGASEMMLVIANLSDHRGRPARTGTPHVRAFRYRDGDGDDHQSVSWVVLPGESPLRAHASMGEFLPEPAARMRRVHLLPIAANTPPEPSEKAEAWASSTALASLALDAKARLEELGPVRMFLSPAGGLEMRVERDGVSWSVDFDEVGSSAEVSARLTRRDAQRGSAFTPFATAGPLDAVLERFGRVIVARPAPEPAPLDRQVDLAALRASLRPARTSHHASVFGKPLSARRSEGTTRANVRDRRGSRRVDER